MASSHERDYFVEAIREMQRQREAQRSGPSIMCCELCKFCFVDWSTVAEDRFCRRYAPKPVVYGSLGPDAVFNWAWPSVQAEDWCGEYQVKLDASPQAS